MDGRGLPRAGSTAPRDFLRAKPEENPEEQACLPEENLINPNSFTWIYILFKIRHFGDFSELFQILILMFKEA